MIRFLAISLFFIFVFSSCSLKTTEGLRQIPSTKNEIENPYFANSELDYVYKAKIGVYSRNFGGIVIIKKIAPQKHRIVMTTEFGGKLLDFQYEDNIFTKNFVIEDLNKKFILNILKRDFKLLLAEKETVIMEYESLDRRVFKVKNGKRFDFYFFTKNNSKLVKIVNTTKTKEKVEVDFKSTDGKIAENISIKHTGIPLKIDLEKFKDE